MKIYLSKLWRGALTVAFIALLEYMLMDVLITAVNVVIPEALSLVRGILYLAIPIFATALVTYLRRQNNGEMRRAYQTDLGDNPFQWLPEIKKVLKSRDYLAELAAFATLLIPIIILFGVMVNIVFTLIFYPLLYAAIDLCLWLLLHRKWAKERLHLSDK